jgi:hypothetical protein
MMSPVLNRRFDAGRIMGIMKNITSTLRLFVFRILCSEIVEQAVHYVSEIGRPRDGNGSLVSSKNPKSR